VVIRPDFTKYSAASRQIRGLMARLTPLMQPLSIDEAVLDMRGTQALHGAPPAVMLARLALEIEREVGVTISVGLAGNRLMSKIAAGRDKPRGFCVIGDDAAAVLAPESVRLLPGVGPALEKRLASRGLTRLGHLQALSDVEARRMLGDDGPNLCARARGIDHRDVDPSRETKSVSAETTFNQDLSTVPELERPLWALCEKLARRLREGELAAGGVVLKLKTARFASRTRAQRLPQPTCLPDRLFAAARVLLAREVDGTPFRLIGVGAAPLADLADADQPDLADPGGMRDVKAQLAVDALRARFGADAIGRGRGFKSPGE
jgi:DNA polymerase-4